MTATERTYISLPSPRVSPRVDWRLASAFQTTATTIVNTLLSEEPLTEAPIYETTVHLPRRGKIWVAAFTGPTGRQLWRTTGLTDRDQALVLAKHWEAEARVRRLSLGRSPRRPILRVRPQRPGAAPLGLLTQKQVAQLLHMSERAVRETERRAFEKLIQHPLLRQVWQRYLAGELDERQLLLTPEEFEALFNMAHAPNEQHLIRKILRLIQW